MSFSGACLRDSNAANSAPFASEFSVRVGHELTGSAPWLQIPVQLDDTARAGSEIFSLVSLWGSGLTGPIPASARSGDLSLQTNAKAGCP